MPKRASTFVTSTDCERMGFDSAIMLVNTMAANATRRGRDFIAFGPLVESGLQATIDLKSLKARQLTRICVMLNDYRSRNILAISVTVSPSIVSCSALPCPSTRPQWAIPLTGLLVRMFAVVEHQMISRCPAAVRLYTQFFNGKSKASP